MVDIENRTALVAAALYAAVFLGFLYRHLERGATAEDASTPGLAYSETAVIRAPARLIEFAKKRQTYFSYQDFLTQLKRTDLEGVWFSYTELGHQENGEVTPVTVLLRAGQNEQNFVETLRILAMLAGPAEEQTPQKQSNVRIAVIPEEMMGLDPRSYLKDIEEAEDLEYRSDERGERSDSNL